MRRTLTLIRREVWEHPSLWAAPLAVTVLMLFGAAFGRPPIPTTGHETGSLPLAQAQMGQAIFALAVLAFGFVQYVTMSVVLWVYATDCLYSERRDRSILFWKSMPISDGATVLIKALVAIVIAPIWVYGLTLLTSLLALGIWTLRVWAGSLPPLFWDTGTWLHIEGVSLVSLVAAMLWYAPLTSYLMLVSAWARRNVYLWVFLPPIVAALVERIAFGTHYLSTVLLYRLGSGWQSSLVVSIERLFTGPAFSIGGPGAAPAQPFAGLDVSHAFSNIDLWVGLAVAAAFLFVATRIRRYRDDS